MQLRQIKTIFHQELDPLFGQQEVDHFFYGLVEHYLGLERFILALRPKYALTKEETPPFFEALSRLKQHEPLQYILGETLFMDLPMKVNASVLIPRPETEELVRWILEEHQPNDPKSRILDMGTGSGCIAIALKKYLPNAQVSGLDASPEALEVAQDNARLNGVKVDFHFGDMLHLRSDDFKPLDVVVSNPPYVRHQEKEHMQLNVLAHEPEMALFVPDDDPLRFYRHIAIFAMETLVHGGQLFLEINQYLAQPMVALLQSHNFGHITVKKDIFGNERMIKAEKP